MNELETDIKKKELLMCCNRLQYFQILIFRLFSILSFKKRRRRKRHIKSELWAIVMTSAAWKSNSDRKWCFIFNQLLFRNKRASVRINTLVSFQKVWTHTLTHSERKTKKKTNKQKEMKKSRDSVSLYLFCTSPSLAPYSIRFFKYEWWLFRLFIISNKPKNQFVFIFYLKC